MTYCNSSMHVLYCNNNNNNSNNNNDSKEEKISKYQNLIEV